MSTSLAEKIRTDVARLCEPGDRDLGTQRNREATRYVIERMRGIGLATQSIRFDVPEWRYGGATIEVGGRTLQIEPGPFSSGLQGAGELQVIRNADEIPAAKAGSVLLLCDEIATTQFTPRDYPFYSDPGHAAILDVLEASGAIAVLAATTKSAMTGAMSPFPLIEEPRFSLPSAYMTAEDGAWLAAHAGETVSITIDSEVMPSTGEQPIGRLTGSGESRVVVCAHVDSKPNTPGALDNAAGVAVMLAAAEILADAAVERTVEFIPFNGEDHTLAPGELAWLGVNKDISDIVLAINIDAAGLPGAPSAYSFYGLDEAMAALAEEVAREHPDVARGPEWPASDHMVFAMRGVPAVAVTSTDFASASGEYSHTPADAPGLLDYDLLAATANYVAELVARV